MRICNARTEKVQSEPADSAPAKTFQLSCRGYLRIDNGYSPARIAQLIECFEQARIIGSIEPWLHDNETSPPPWLGDMTERLNFCRRCRIGSASGLRKHVHRTNDMDVAITSAGQNYFAHIVNGVTIQFTGG